MTTLLFVVTVTLLVSTFCSLLEAMLYSTRVVTLEAATRISAKRPAAERFLKMKQDLSGPTSAILILNTIAHTAGATLSGMYAAEVLGASWVPLFSVVFTFAILFLSEILPKTYGATHWRSLWDTLVWPLAFIEKALYPLIVLTQRFANLFTRQVDPHAITEAEILATIRMGAEAGELTHDELRMLNAVFQLDKLYTRQVMVPRGEVVFFDASQEFSEILAVARKTRHTRYPLCEGSLDNVIGIVHIKDLLGLSPGQAPDLKLIARPAHFVPETKRINQLLRDMQHSHQHMAIVVDEHGTVAGIVTLENVIEEIIGRVQDEFDREAPDVIRDRSGGFIAMGTVPLERLNRRFELELAEPGVNTLSGLISARLGRFPKPGDVVDLGPMQAEVLAAEKARATRIRLVWKDKRPEKD